MIRWMLARSEVIDLAKQAKERGQVGGAGLSRAVNPFSLSRASWKASPAACPPALR